SQHRVGGGGPLLGSGLHYLSVEHQGNRTSSVEEAHVVAELVAGLLGRPWTDETGERALGLADVLVVGPYNAQAATLKRGLLGAARVGTVDKSRGQRAPVVISSMHHGPGKANIRVGTVRAATAAAPSGRARTPPPRLVMPTAPAAPERRRSRRRSGARGP